MPNFLNIYKSLLFRLMNHAGLKPQAIEIKPGTVINIWAQKKPNDKPAVVFLHGFAGDGIITWQFQVLSLAKNYAVYVPDLLFFGGSITDKPDRTVKFQADCMEKAVRQLGVRRCTVVGFSYGVCVAAKMAEMYPEMVEAVVAANSVMAMTESISTAALERVGFHSWADLLLPDSVEGVKTMFQIGSYKFPRMPRCIFQDYLEKMFDNRKERAELLQAFVISDKGFSVPNLPQRIHLVFGREDKIFDMETACNQKQQIGENATMHVVEKAGHLSHLERPFVYNKLLKKILASLREGKCNGQNK